MSITINHQTNDISVAAGGSPTLGGQPPIAVEQNPEQDENGVWRQVWILISAPEPEPEQSVIDPLSNLTEEQKLALIELLKTTQ